MLLAPAPPIPDPLAVFKSPTSVQELPSHCSVKALFPAPGGTNPPKPRALVCVPAPAQESRLRVFKLAADEDRVQAAARFVPRMHYV